MVEWADRFQIPIYPHADGSQWVSFMNSYPNLIPLSAAEVRRNKDTTAPYQFERLYGAWCERVVTHDAHDAVLRSVERYVRALETVRS
jgi:hypothetical protein